ncbi:hypothetical protein HDA32_006080 [Spinactinospora alkalitolerans]|uniref:Uncharacterized protein n=1 Tax=Spinactinospora alkalitolerans TaxID=687207 RepID=A0A852UAG2_9ACTN|nr:hypothetical protein [Spinactinospora alkalitolerans]
MSQDAKRFWAKTENRVGMGCLGAIAIVFIALAWMLERPSRIRRPLRRHGPSSKTPNTGRTSRTA